MANHGYITSTKHFNKDKVLIDMQEINQRRFKGLLTIEPRFNGEQWIIYFGNEKDKYVNGVDFWLASKRKIEHRHEDFFLYYIEVVFSEELGKKYNGTLSDESDPYEKWKPNPKKYPSYKSWLELKYSWFKNRVYAKEVIELELSRCPEYLRGC